MGLKTRDRAGTHRSSRNLFTPTSCVVPRPDARRRAGGIRGSQPRADDWAHTAHVDGGSMRGGLVGVALLAVLSVAGCADHAAPARSARPTPVAASVRTPSAAAAPARRARPCTVADLDVRFRPKSEGGVDGAGGHLISILDLRNVGDSRCVLAGYPRRVTVSQPGRPTITATNGSFFPVSASAAMAPGEATALGVETESECATRPGGGPSGPRYQRIRISVPGGVIRLVAPRARALDVGCGVHLTTFTRWN